MAEHLLNRLAYGPRPGDVEALEQSGPDGAAQWIERQLNPGEISDEPVDRKLHHLKTLHAYLKSPKGFPYSTEISQALRDDLSSQRLILAAESDKQLQEMLVDFWLNHFALSVGYRDLVYHIPFLERDIRSQVFGSFEDLLSCVARSPAMLSYFDNHVNTAEKREHGLNETYGNENYGREVMELHTLGVDGGYTEQDVREAARIFTGWMVEGAGPSGKFVFHADRHDSGKKEVLQHHFDGTGGQKECEQFLHILAHHPSTAAFISRKLVRFFVNDTPPESLVKRVSARFQETQGNLKEVYRTIFSGIEFAARSNFKAKYKTPFQYVVSNIRAVGSTVHPKTDLPDRLKRMGQPIYLTDLPVGNADTEDYWLNTGAFLERIEVTLALHSPPRLLSPEFQMR
jgi:uncharacterized protein (DUF1800 family)